MANSVDPDQTAPIGAVCSGYTLFASMLNSSVMLGNYLQQTTFSDAFFFLGALRVKRLVLTLQEEWRRITREIILRIIASMPRSRVIVHTFWCH